MGYHLCSISHVNGNRVDLLSGRSGSCSNRCLSLLQRSWSSGKDCDMRPSQCWLTDAATGVSTHHGQPMPLQLLYLALQIRQSPVQTVRSTFSFIGVTISKSRPIPGLPVDRRNVRTFPCKSCMMSRVDTGQAAFQEAMSSWTYTTAHETRLRVYRCHHYSSNRCHSDVWAAPGRRLPKRTRHKHVKQNSLLPYWSAGIHTCICRRDGFRAPNSVGETLNAGRGFRATHSLASPGVTRKGPKKGSTANKLHAGLTCRVVFNNSLLLCTVRSIQPPDCHFIDASIVSN